MARHSGLGAGALGAACLTALLLGCGSPERPPILATISIIPDSMDLIEGDTARLSCTGYDESGDLLAGTVCDYTASDSSIATITPSGLVTALAPGLTSINASSSGVTAHAAITVRRAIGAIEISPDTIELDQFGSIQPTITVHDGRGHVITPALTFETSDFSIASVSEAGVVTSTGKAGTTVLFVSTDSLQGNALVLVRQTPTSVRGSPVILAPGATGQVDGAVLDAVGAPIPELTVSYSGGDGLITIATDGKVQAGGTEGRSTYEVSYDTLKVAVRFSVATPPPLAIQGTATVGGTQWRIALTPGGTAVTGSADGIAAAVSIPGLTTTALPGGGSILGVAVDPAGQFAYLAGMADSVLGPIGVGIVDLSTDQLVGYLQHGDDGPPWSVAVSPDNQYVYVGTGEGKLQVYAVATRTWVTTLALPGGLNHMAFHPTQPWMYVSSATGEGPIYEIDRTTQSLRRTLTRADNEHAQSQGLSVSPDGQTLYVENEGYGTEAWDLASGQRVWVGSHADAASGLVVSPDGNWLYIAGWGGGRVIIDDAWTLLTAGQVSTGGFPRSLALSADGTTLVVNNVDGRVQVLR